MDLPVKSEYALSLVATLGGSVLGLLGTFLVRRWSLGHGFVDRPGGHKAHAAPVALGGGIAIAFAVAAPMILAVVAARLWAHDAPAWLPESVRIHLGGVLSKAPLAWAIVGSVAVTCLVGLYDDARPVSARIKLLFQLAVAVLLVVGFNLRLLSHLGNIPSIILSVLWIVTLMNSINFLDNMDGLAAGVALIAAAVFALAAMRDGQVFVPTCCWLLVGSLAGFLPLNFHPAKIFMGDAGSMVIGLLLGVFTILTTFADPARGQQPIGALAPLVVMAVPLYDTASVVFLRWRLGVPIWTGDRRHFSHRLVRRGMSVPHAVLVIWLATLVTALPALLLATASWPVAWGIAVQTVLVVALVALLERSGPRDEKKGE
jgi:UDP-GlcNAc:undecaprenyl-phosphate GlcNAc-1-phosphate transferase